jgi:PAS domain S-box-containing protein
MPSTARRRSAASSPQHSGLPFREILDNAPDAVIVVDPFGTIREWNRQAEITFGWSAAHAIGRSLTEVILPPHARAGHDLVLARLSGVGPERAPRSATQRVELTARDREGREFPIELSMTPIRHGEDLWVSAFVRDLSARRQAEEQVRFQASLLRNVRDSVIATDLAGRVEYWNAGAEEIFGYTAEEMLGRTLDVVYPDRAPGQLASDLQGILSCEGHIGDWLGRR